MSDTHETPPESDLEQDPFLPPGEDPDESEDDSDSDQNDSDDS